MPETLKRWLRIMSAVAVGVFLAGCALLVVDTVIYMIGPH
jgi:hypothetical protein